MDVCPMLASRDSVSAVRAAAVLRTFSGRLCVLWAPRGEKKEKFTTRFARDVKAQRKDSESFSVSL
jgi:hypothetical protein